MSNWVLCLKKRKSGGLWRKVQSDGLMAASRAAHLFFSYHLPSPLQPWHKCEGMSKGVDVLGMLQPFAPAKCFDANQQTKPGFVGEYVFLWLNQHVSQSQVMAREVCFSGFCIPECLATQEATKNWRPVATRWQMQRYHLSIQFPHHFFEKKEAAWFANIWCLRNNIPFNDTVSTHSRPGMSNTEALCRAASEVTWWSHLFCSPNFASQVGGGILLCSVIWLLSLWQLVWGKGWNRLAAQQASFSSHHPVCLPLPWHRFCVGTPNSSDLKQLYPSKFWCIKLLCQLSFEVAWMHSVQMFVHICAGKCCCTSKSRRSITISQSSDRNMFATCIKKEIGGMPSDQWLPTQLSSWHRLNLPTQNLQVCSHFGGWSTKVSHD